MRIRSFSRASTRVGNNWFGLTLSFVSLYRLGQKFLPTYFFFNKTLIYKKKLILLILLLITNFLIFINFITNYFITNFINFINFKLNLSFFHYILKVIEKKLRINFNRK